MAGSVELLRQAVRANFQQVEAWVNFESSFEQAYKQALNHVNKDVPRYRNIEFTGDSTQSYTLDQTAYWDKESSNAILLEYPINEIPRSYLDRDDGWFIYEDNTGVIKVVLVDYSPSATEKFRMLLSCNHTFDDTTSTLGNQAYAALVAKTTELIAKMLEARLIYSANPLIDADTVQFGDKPRNFKFFAQYWCEEYKKFAGLSDDVKAAQAIAEIDTRSNSGGNYMWHPTRLR